MTSYATVDTGLATPVTTWGAGGATPPRNGRPVTPWGAGQPGQSGITPYSATNNLIGSQINPTASANTQRATGNATNAQQALAGYGFTPYSQTAPADYSQTNGLLTDANRQMQGATYNYGAANNQYNNASGALVAGQNKAAGYLENAGNLGLSAYTGGGGSGGAAAHADTSALNAGIDQSNQYVGSQFADAADTQKLRAQTAAQYEKSLNAPNRASLGAENLALYEERSLPGYEQALRATNQKNAAMGRRGSGLVTSELADLGAVREKDISQQRRQLAADAAGQTLNDNLNLTNAGLGLTQGFGAEDRAGVATRLGQAGQLTANANSRFAGEALNANLQDAAYGRAEQAAGRNAAGAATYANVQRGVGNDVYGMSADQAGQYNRMGDSLATQEGNRVANIGNQATFQRGAANDLAGYATTNYGQRNQQAQQARADEYAQQGVLAQNAQDFTGFQNGERTNDANNRNEFRTERDFQTGRADKATQDEIDRVRLEEDLRNSGFDRSYRTASLGYGAPSPGTAYNTASNYYGNQANNYAQAAGDLATSYGARRRTGAGTGTPTTTYGGY